MSEPCVWTRDTDQVFETSCGQAFLLNDGTPAENGLRFCCYCGKPLAVVMRDISEDDDEVLDA